MTNGEKMQTVFPDIEMWGESKDTLDYSLGGMIHRVTKSWWNAEYTEPTINDDCAEKNGCTFCSLDNGEDCCRKLYEESMQELTTKNNLGVDCIDRQATLDAIIKRLGIRNESYLLPAEKTLYLQVKDMPSVTLQSLTEIDILELKHRFGDEVEYVIRDMLSGENLRWEGSLSVTTLTETDIKEGVDCIDRQAAITFVCKNTEEILKDTMPLEVKLSDDYLYENVAKIMRNPKVLTSVTPIRPKGHWYIWKDEYGDIVDAICSNCKNHGHHKWIYCPNCGSYNGGASNGNE